jgi:guanylate kinase
MTTVARSSNMDATTGVRSGYLVVISAPSGGGKTSIIRGILNTQPSDFKYSISMTTRPPRPGERHGRDYFFISDEEFQKKIRENGFVEWAVVHNHHYGTPRIKLEKWLAAGKFVIMDLDVQGGLNVKKTYGEQAILIFIEPPSMESLQARLRGRNTDSQADIDVRLQAAKREMAMAEQYDYTIINNELQDTVKQVTAIIDAHRSPAPR